MYPKIKKVAIIGTGFVGSTTAFSLMQSGLVSEIALVDINEKKAEGEAMDLSHAAMFIKPVDIYHGDYSACKDANLVIYTAGKNQKKGQTRLDLVQDNVNILKESIPKIIDVAPNTILLMVTNPVDIMTYAALKISGLPPERVFGSGTVLDSSRFRFAISEIVNIDPRNVHGFVIGEHGDSGFPVWSLLNIGVLDINSYCKKANIAFTEEIKNKVSKQVKNAAYEIISRKQATYYAISLGIKRIVEAVLRDENSILTVSGLISGHYGLNDICTSVPSIVNRQGRVSYLDIPLSKEEQELLYNSANTLKDIQKHLKL